MKRKHKITYYRPGKVGCAFKNGKLYEFTDRHLLVMTSWPDPRAWYKRRSHDWRPTRELADELLCSRFAPQEPFQEPHRAVLPPMLTSGQILLPGLLWADGNTRADFEQRERNIISAYLGTVPPEVCSEMLKFSNRRWHVLNILARCPGAMDLCRSNPALLYALASNWAFHKPAVQQPIRAARSLVNKKQKAILDWLGFPACEPARRILAKIVPQSIVMLDLLWMQRCLRDPFVVKMLSHLDRINAGALGLTLSLNCRKYLTPRLVEEVSHEASEDVPHPPVMGIIWDILRMMERIGDQHSPKKFVNLVRLREIHDHLAARMPYERFHFTEGLDLVFPNPPFPGTPTICPITKSEDLYTEGFVMKHCVGAYSVDVANGWEYVYRVLEPVRATLSIVKRAGKWVADQLYQACNTPVPRELHQRIFLDLFESGGKVLNT